MTSSQAQSPGGPHPPTAADQPPVAPIRITGPATSEDVAAVLAVLAAAGAPSGAGDDRPRSLWADPRTSLRRPVQHFPGAWRVSLRH